MRSIPGSNLFSLGDNRRYDEELLQSRHSASDWLHNVFTLPRSSVLRDIRNPVVTIALWGALVSILQRIMAGSSSKVFSKFASDICIGSAPHSFLVSSLGLLLVFRTNSAYQRFNVSACQGKCLFFIIMWDCMKSHTNRTPPNAYYRRVASFGKIFYPFRGISHA
jgi:hypothetical protein